MAVLSVIYSNFCGMVVSETRSGVESDYVSDTLGSTIGLMGSTGALTDRWEYWPYGEVASRTGTNVTPLTFLGVIGYFKDLLDKLFYVRARNFRVDLARWLTVDPLWPEEDAYRYCSSKPVLSVDPSGLAGPDEDELECCLNAAILGAAAAAGTPPAACLVCLAAAVVLCLLPFFGNAACVGLVNACDALCGQAAITAIVAALAVFLGGLVTCLASGGCGAGVGSYKYCKDLCDSLYAPGRKHQECMIRCRKKEHREYT